MAAKRRERVKVTAFPAGGLCRMDWVGPLQVLDRGPVFPVQFSRVRQGIEKIVDNESIYEPRAFVTRVNCGYAPILQPGTIWQDQTFRSRWPFNQITAETMVHAGIPVLSAYGKLRIDGHDRYVLPHGRVKVDSRVAGSRLAAFTANVDQEQIALIVPCNEIFRFYYGHSTQLAYRILRGELVSAPHCIYDRDSSWVGDDGGGRLELAPSMDLADAYTIARIVLDEVGLRRANAIVTRAAIAEGGSAPIDVPPFNGPWRVRVRGKWLSYGRSRAFLVYAIVKCGSELPFKNLAVFGGFKREKSEESGSPSGIEDAPISRRRTTAPPELITVEAGDPGAQALPKRLPALDKDDRYPNVPIFRVTRRRRRGSGFGKGSVTSTVSARLPAAAVSDAPVDEGPSPGFFAARPRSAPDIDEGRDLWLLCQQAINVLGAAANASGYACDVRRRVLDFSEVFSSAPPPWIFLDRARKETRSIFIANIKLNGIPAVVIETQRRPRTREELRTLVIADAVLEELGEDKLLKVLSRIAIRGGHLRELDDIPILRNVRLSGTNHLQTDSAEQFAARILGKIVELIDEINATALG